MGGILSLVRFFNVQFLIAYKVIFHVNYIFCCNCNKVIQLDRSILIEIASTNKIDNPKVNGALSNKYVDKSYCYIDYPNIIKTNSFNGYSKKYSNIDTSNCHYNVKVDKQQIKQSFFSLLSIFFDFLSLKDLFFLFFFFCVKSDKKPTNKQRRFFFEIKKIF